MKWLFISLLWLLAAVIAIAVLWRLWRGQNIVLRGRWSPCVVRMVAVILVVLGVGVEKSRPGPIPQATSSGKGQKDQTLPVTITPLASARWQAAQQPGSPWAIFKKEFAQSSLTGVRLDAVAAKKRAWAEALPPKFREVVEADLDALAAGRNAPPVGPAQALRILDEAEGLGVIDHWLCAYLWRRTVGGEHSDPGVMIAWYTRLGQHARLTNTLIRAQALRLQFDQGPAAWRGKGGRPRFPLGGLP